MALKRTEHLFLETLVVKFSLARAGINLTGVCMRGREREVTVRE